MFSLQPPGVLRSELDTPQPDRFVADSNTSLGQQIFDISVAQGEAVVEPHRVTDNLRWKPVSLVCIHPLIVSQGDLTWQYHHDGQTNNLGRGLKISERIRHQRRLRNAQCQRKPFCSDNAVG
jgi:hypothetical protein